MRAAAVATCLILTVLAFPAAGAQSATFDLYLTSAPSTTVSDAEQLSTVAPTGGTAVHQFIPALDVPTNTYVWASDDPTSDDIVLGNSVNLLLHFDLGVQPTATVAATLDAMTPAGAVNLGSGSAGITLQVLAATSTVPIDVAGKTVPEGSTYRLTISVTGISVLAQMQYGSATAPSALQGFSATLLDSDGDGFGDSDERRQGTDPNDVDSWPGNPDTDNDGLPDAWEMTHFGNLTQNGTGDPDGDGFPNADEFSGGSDPNDPDDPEVQEQEVDEDDGAPMELLLASLLLLVCLAAAGIARLWRYPA